MAYQDRFYTIGAVTVQNGSAVVTGTGTGWETALIDGGVVFVGGGSYPIYSVESETSLTLAYPFTGVSGADLPYAVDRQRAAATSNIQMNDRLAQIIREIGVGNIEEFNALTLQPDKSLSTDSQGNLQLSNLGALGRALLALATGTNAQYVRGDGTLQTLNSATIGLGNVNNTSDADKPVSNATQTALNAKFSTSGGTLSGGVNITSNGDSAVRFLNTSSYGYTVYFNSGNGTTDAGLQIVHSSGGLVATFLYNRSLAVVGALSKGSGTFLIDHPKDPLNKNLRHGFVESTEYVNIYRGMIDLVDGRMTVDIDAAFGMTDGTFAALNADVMVTSLQNQFGKDRVWVEAPADSGKFTIICENPESTATVAWMVTGRRKDAFVCSDLDPNTDSEGRFMPEFDKPEYIEQESDHA